MMSIQTDHAAVAEEATVVKSPPYALISWGAVIAGLIFIIALSWLMLLLGSAIGVSVADASDAESISQGFTIGASIWMLLTALICYFLGALLTARLAGSDNETVGLLHGITLWSVATVITVLMTYWGITSAVQTGISAATSVAGAAGSTLSSAAQAGGTAITQGGQALAWAGDQFAETQLADSIAARVRRQAAEMAAEVEASGGAEVSQEDAQEALSNLNAETLQKVAANLIAGDTEAAKQAMADETNLSGEQVDELVEGVQQSITESTAAEEAQARLDQAAKQTAQWLSSHGGSNVSQSEARRAVEQLDSATIQRVAVNLISGNVEGAKSALAANTTLSEEQINSIVDSVNKEFQERVDQFQQQAGEVVETASTYSQAVLWGTFVCSALALVVSIVGGWIGAANVHRNMVVSARREFRV